MHPSSVQPFVLKSMRPIATPRSDANRVFDPRRKPWILRAIRRRRRRCDPWREAQHCSAWGETATTKTSEGHDQSEGVRGSDWGETSITETSEGVDQSEVLSASSFGETLITATIEGADQSEQIARDDQ